MNSVNLIGRIVRDPEIRVTDANLSIATFTLAVDRTKKDAGADFINCTAFGKTAELIEQYLHKGSQMAISGHIQTGSYEKEGRKVYTFAVVVDRLYFIGSKSDKQSTPVDSNTVPGFEVIEDIPF